MSQRFSQGSQSSLKSQSSTPRSPAITISAREATALGHDVVRYMLMCDFNKHPIKLADIRNDVMKEHKSNAKYIMTSAQKMLKDVYGMDMIDMGGKYILVNRLQHQDHVALPDEIKLDLTLLTLVLSYIFMTGGNLESSVDQARLAEFLQNFDVELDDTAHVVFGDVKKLFDAYKSQQYLVCKKVPNSDPPKLEFSWGDRAKNEISLRNILEFVSEMTDVDNIERWAAHYEEVQKQEKKPAMNGMP